MAKATTFYRVPDLNKALRKLPKTATVELRQAAKAIASKVAETAAASARAQGGIAALVAPSIRATSDRVPAIRMGNTTRLPTQGNGWQRPRTGKRQTIGDVIWGAEFGSITYSQFSAWRGSDTGAGYFLWPAVRDDARFIADKYDEALMDAMKKVKPTGGTA